MTSTDRLGATRTSRWIGSGRTSLRSTDVSPVRTFLSSDSFGSDAERGEQLGSSRPVTGEQHPSECERRELRRKGKGRGTWRARTRATSASKTLRSCSSTAASTSSSPATSTTVRPRPTLQMRGGDELMEGMVVERQVPIAYNVTDPAGLNNPKAPWYSARASLNN